MPEKIGLKPNYSLLFRLSTCHLHWSKLFWKITRGENHAAAVVTSLLLFCIFCHHWATVEMPIASTNRSAPTKSSVHRSHIKPWLRSLSWSAYFTFSTRFVKESTRSPLINSMKHRPGFGFIDSRHSSWPCAKAAKRCQFIAPKSQVMPLYQQPTNRLQENDYHFGEMYHLSCSADLKICLRSWRVHMKKIRVSVKMPNKNTHSFGKN